ncbi:hypothetical protein BigBertha_186 [Bacillus phage BigBertha]|uniref:Uncharacterized protein n=1 Tax=Bacillus phage BigBertha TaxID=1406781 RepID=U5PS30_9CAUD|nr:hypothetical protein BigBertha_186 [Bacillus phage BigBertha]AGY46694.1 hypothetical protein BigBertha_186 [Bacillus phage BigBertha]
MELKTVYAVYTIDSMEEPELELVFEHKPDAERYRDLKNKNSNGIVFRIVEPVKFKPREIW